MSRSEIAIPEFAPAEEILAARLHVEQWRGSGPRILLIHAIGFDHRSWEPIRPYLEGEYRVAAVDLPGHGESEKPRGVEYRLRALGARIIRLLDELGWDDAILAGNSLGGGTALAAAVQAPERVRGLALVNSVGFSHGLPLLGRLAFVPLLPRLSALAPGLAIRLGLEFARCRWGSVTLERRSACREYLRSVEGRDAFFGALRQLYGGELNWMSARYGEITCPSMVLHGERDRLIPLRHAEGLAAAIPNARLVRLPSCGHFPQEEHPELTARELRRFVDEVCHPMAGERREA